MPALSPRALHNLIFSLAFPAFALFGAAACGDTGDDVVLGPTGSEDTVVDGALGEVGSDVPDAPTVADTLQPDVPVVPPDAAADADTAVADAGACPGSPGCGCAADAECKSGQCVANAAGAKACSATCDPKLACDDGDACTEGEACAKVGANVPPSGSCAGGKAKACDDGNVCTQDSCDPKKGCQLAEIVSPCDDANACTSGDTCGAGKCTGKAVACDDGNPCTDDACVPKTGCVITNNGTACVDGNACTLADACENGACAGGKGKVCDDGNPCTQDTCDSKSGACAATAATAVCDDGSLCTENDACKDGQCAGGSKVCDDGNPCTTDGCDAKTGCTFLDNQGPCDDGNACSDFDKCAGGKCKGAAKDAEDCDDDNPCTTDGCDKKTGCTATPNTAVCDDGNACTKGDACAAGKCASGVNACDCTQDSECAGKEDGNLCNGTLFCDKAKSPFQCVVNPKTVVACDASADNACAQNKCDAATGKCQVQPQKEGQACDADGTVCTQGDQCSAGTCKAGAAVTCNDDNPCTLDTCDAVAGCKYSAGDAACDADGNACTVGDVCKDKVCVAGKVKVCDDDNPCTQDVCDKKAGACGFDAKAKDGELCDADGSNCTFGDACAAGLCGKGKLLDCDDKNVCTLDACNPQSGCLSVATTGSCDADGDACTVGDACSGKACEPGPQKKCDDGDVCTTDSCDKAKGTCSHAAVVGCGGNCTDVKDCDDGNPCTDGACASGKCAYKANTATCDDANSCTKGDACTGGKCGGSAIGCDDGKPCTADSCDPKVGCVNANSTAPCEDGNPCTTGDACKGGVCGVGVPKTCDDGDVCTKDSCNPGDGSCKFNGIAGCGPYCAVVADCDDKNPCTDHVCAGGKCINSANTLGCNDTNPCTGPDVCGTGKCNAGPAKDCSDNNGCTIDSCDGKTGACVNLAVAPTTPCDDASACTSGDVCAQVNGKAVCTGKAKSCDDGNVCTTDTCDPKSAGCATAANTVACDDGAPCSVSDACKGGSCVAGTSVWVDTLAGAGPGFADGTGVDAKFQFPYGVAVDKNGTTFVADATNHRIRKVTVQGVTTTIAGSGAPGFLDAKGALALLNSPYGLAIDAAGTLFVADTFNSAIRKISTGGDVTAIGGTGVGGFKDGPSGQAMFNRPHGIAVGPAGALYIADTQNHRIRVLSAQGIVSTLAGDGVAGTVDGDGVKARLNNPIGIAVDAQGTLWFADQSAHRIRKVTAAGKVTSVAGSGIQGFLDGGSAVARFNFPWGVAVSPNGILFVADRYNHRIRRLQPTGKPDEFTVDTWVGNGAAAFKDGVAGQAQLHYPAHIAFDASGYLYIGDSHNHRIRRVRDASNPCEVGGKCYVAGAVNPANSCQVCKPAASASQWSTQADGGACSDGKACTGSDACDKGSCAGTDVACDDGDACTLDACDAVSGVCSAAAIVGCNGNCTDAGDCDDKNLCTTDACSNGKCTNANNTAACDDGNACSLGDACKGGNCAAGTQVQVSTLAGKTQGYVEGKGDLASMYRPGGLAIDAKGNIFVAEFYNHVIRKVAPDGTTSTVAGSGSPGFADGKGALAAFHQPSDVKLGANGNLYVADTSNHRIRVITPDGTVSTLAGGPAGYVDGAAALARFNNPYALAVSATGVVYVSDYSNHRIRRIQGGAVTTVAGSIAGFGNGKGALAKFNGPLGMALTGSGSLVVADQLNHRIRHVTPQGEVTVLAGAGIAGYLDGDAAGSHFNAPWGVAVDSAGTVYVADRANQRLRRIEGGLVAKLAGTGQYGFVDGVAGSAQFANPIGIAVDARGVVFVGDGDNNRLRRVVDSQKPCAIGGACYAQGLSNPSNSCEACLPAKSVTGWSGRGDGDTCSDGKPCTQPDACTGGSCAGKTVDCDDKDLCTTDACDSASGACSSVPILGCNGYCDKDSQCDDKNGCTTDTCAANKCQFVNNGAGCDDGNACTIGDNCVNGACTAGVLVNVGTLAGSGVAGYADATGTTAVFNYPFGVEVGAAGTVWVADTGNHRIRKVLADGTTTTFAGSGNSGFQNAKGAAAWFHSPADVALDAAGNLYVADRDNHAVRKVAPDGTVSSLAGGGAAGFIDAAGTSARFNTPYSLAVTPAGVVYVADYGNHRVRKVLANGVVSTIAGGAAGYTDGKGANAKFNGPIGIALDSHGALFISDYSNHRIRKVTADGVVTTVAGAGIAGLNDGTAAEARFQHPWGIAVDSAGSVFVADRYNHRLRKVAGGLVSTWAGSGAAGFLDGAGPAARFHYPANLTIDARGTVFVGDGHNHRIRHVRDTASSCAIGGACYSHGLDNPAASCQACDGVKAPTQWSAKADTSACSDGEFCTVTDTCGSGVCAGAKACDDKDACTADACDAATGACSSKAIANCP